ncbi:chaplin [Streptomyces apocyni]|uniref:chaplin n=1 Tax=Streptomyces apocyni TaxID=2654677 RepID=UPI001E5C96C0|nr:chaplin [Streptomyces apocyni]
MALKKSATLVAGVVMGLGMGAQAFADSHVEGGASDSPGILSGNSLEAPVDVPVNACGNTADGAAALNPAFGNTCANTSTSEETERGYGDDQPPVPPTEPKPQSPPPAAPEKAVPEKAVPAPKAPEETELAATGTDPRVVGAAAAGVALLAGGGVLYRRSSRSAAR